MSQVNFRSGEAYDVKIITELAHRYGVRVLWDLSHSVGVLPVNLAANHVDFAVGCGYKFLNGGPGAPAFVYVNHELQQQLKQPLTGWMGHSAPFDFNPEYQPAPGIDRFLAGTPGILGMSALDAALDLWREVCLDTVVEKSQHLSRLFIEMVQQSPVLNSPENNLEIIHVSARGSQVSLRHPQAFAISQALIDCGIICDFRFPDLVRFGFAPLYIRYQDILTATESLAEIMSTKRYQQSQFQQPGKIT
jgi:kynureninase